MCDPVLLTGHLTAIIITNVPRQRICVTICFVHCMGSGVVGESAWGGGLGVGAGAGGGGDSLFGLIRSKEEIRCSFCRQARRRKCSERYARVEFWTLSAHHTNGCTAVGIENRYNHIYSSTLCLQPGYLRPPSLVISHDLKNQLL